MIMKTSTRSELDRIHTAEAPLEAIPEFLRAKPAEVEDEFTAMAAVLNGRAADLNPKTLMGRRKVPNLSVVPPTAILYLGLAMRYGAYESPRKDGTHGYGPYNWRDQPVEASTYVDAAMRHLMQYWDGEDIDPSSGAPHLAHALATLAVLVDAIENNTCADDRPGVRKNVASMILDRETKSF